jgi:hypothetical protein
MAQVMVMNAPWMSSRISHRMRSRRNQCPVGVQRVWAAAGPAALAAHRRDGVDER